MKSQSFASGRQRRIRRLRFRILPDSREWFRGWILIALLSVSPAVPAAAIHEAAKSGDLEQIQRLAMGGADVNERAVRDETPLMLAALAGNGAIVNYLLQRGANIDARNDSGLSALHAAAYAGHTDIALLLVAKGAKVNDASNKFGVTPLHLASEENHIDTLQALLRLGADTTLLEINGYSALSRAGFRQHWEIVEALLAEGASCQPADAVGEWLHRECTLRAKAN